MKQTLIATIVAIFLTIGAFIYSGSQTGTTIEKQFNDWKIEFKIGHDYNAAENLYRMKIFEKNINEINKHNSLLGRSYDMGLNHFTHLTKEEFTDQYLGTFEQNKNYQ